MKMQLVMKIADGSERPFPLRSDRMIIGREVRCDVRLAVPSVADRHCELTRNDDGITLSDLGSDLGTYHNGRRVERVMLRHADTLTVGPVTFEVRMHQDPEIVTRPMNGEAPFGLAMEGDGLAGAAPA